MSYTPSKVKPIMIEGIDGDTYYGTKDKAIDSRTNPPFNGYLIYAYI